MADFNSPEDALADAQQKFDSGEVKAARDIIESGEAGVDHSTVTGVGATWLLAQIYGSLDMYDAERELLLDTIRLAPGFGLEAAAAAAQERLRVLDELGRDSGL